MAVSGPAAQQVADYKNHSAVPRVGRAATAGTGKRGSEKRGKKNERIYMRGRERVDAFTGI